MQTIHDTGRRYFASTAEAFAEAERKTVAYACAIERSQPDRTLERVTAICLVIAAAVGLMAAFGWIPGGN